MLLRGRQAALVDSGFVGHANDTLEWAVAHTGGSVDLVVNTHWHADHVGGNAALQASGALIAASAPDADAVHRRDPGCCLAAYLDQPVAPYTVDRALHNGQVLRLGDEDWQVVRTPGHTPGHLSLWQPDEGLLAGGDTLSDYDVGWVNLALDGPEAAAVALTSLQRLADLRPRVLLPSHGPIPADPAAAFEAGLRRARRLVDDPDGAVWYAARRIFAYALMIRDGLHLDDVEAYLTARAWLHDAARLLHRGPELFAAELIGAMRRSGAVVERNRRLHAAAEHEPVAQHALEQPLPPRWPPPQTAGTQPTAPRHEGAAT